MRQRYMLEGEGEAPRVKYRVGIVVVGFARENALDVPGIPVIQPDVAIPGAQPKFVAVKNADEGRPGHHDDEKRHDDEAVQVPAHRLSLARKS